MIQHSAEIEHGQQDRPVVIGQARRERAPIEAVVGLPLIVRVYAFLVVNDEGIARSVGFSSSTSALSGCENCVLPTRLPMDRIFCGRDLTLLPR